MKKFLVSIFLLIFSSNVVLADCDWSTGIRSLPDGNYEYSKNCHIAVGQLVQSNKILTQQLADLNKAITLKDLALQQSDSRATLWSNTSSQLEDRLQKVDSLEKHNEFLFFGLGVLSAVAVGFATAKLVGR